jgi:ABC-type multidrug transport system ATPase subunit
LENVRYARQDATDEDVFEACRAASIHDKILTFPDGYKTKVGERGVKLSGGELQRVSIARVFLKNPKIVLLDEATSAIDSATESAIQESFRKLSRGRTTFIIAHRLSTIMDADCILVVDKGMVVERGTHQELLDLNGNYVNLWNKQSSKKNESGGSSVTAAGEHEVLILDLPTSSSSPIATPSESRTDGLSLLDRENDFIDQIDGHSGSKQMKGSNPKRNTSGKASSITSCFKGDKKNQSDNDADDENGADSAADAPLQLISPRPTDAVLEAAVDPSKLKRALSKGKGKQADGAQKTGGSSTEKKPDDGTPKGG